MVHSVLSSIIAIDMAFTISQVFARYSVLSTTGRVVRFSMNVLNSRICVLLPLLVIVLMPFDEVRHIESHVGLLTSTLVCGVVVDDFIHFRQG